MISKRNAPFVFKLQILKLWKHITWCLGPTICSANTNNRKIMNRAEQLVKCHQLLPSHTDVLTKIKVIVTCTHLRRAWTRRFSTRPLTKMIGPTKG